MRASISVGPRAVLLLLVMLGLVMYGTGWLGDVTSGLAGGARSRERSSFQLGLDREEMISGHVTGTETAEGSRRRWLQAGQQITLRYSVTREAGRVRLAVAPVGPVSRPLWTVLLESSARDTVPLTAPTSGNYELLVRRTEFRGEYVVGW